MSALYPTTLPSFDEIINRVGTTAGTRISASVLNNLQDEVLALATELGLNPSGGSATVKDRLDINAGNWTAFLVEHLADGGHDDISVNFVTIASPTGGIIMNDESSVGLGPAKGRLVFDDEAVDTITVKDADLLVEDGQGVVVGYSAQVAVGGDTPELQVLGEGVADSSMLIGQWSTGTDGPTLKLLKSHSPSIGGLWLVQDGDDLGSIEWYADDGTDLVTQAAWIRAVVDGTPGANDMPTALIFGTTADGAASPTEWLRIGPDGIGAFTVGIRVAQDVTDVSDPPLDSELDAIFGTPATLGEGFIGTIDDNDGNTDVWLVYTSDTSWFHLQGTKAL